MSEENSVQATAQNDYIGIVMGGYLDENNKLMDRPELNKRISLKTKKIADMGSLLETLATLPSTPQVVVDEINELFGKEEIEKSPVIHYGDEECAEQSLKEFKNKWQRGDFKDKAISIESVYRYAFQKGMSEMRGRGDSDE